MEIDQLHAIFLQNFDEDQLGLEIDWRDEEAEQKQGAWTLLETYLQQTPIPVDEKPHGVEVTLEADLSERGLPTLVGVLDLVRPGGLIVDFKTMSQTPKDDRAEHFAELQLACYAVLYREATGERNQPSSCISS